jgi:hypothetical protein
MANKTAPAVQSDTDTLPVRAASDRVRSAIAEMQRDSSDVAEQIMANILNADSVDDVFDQTGGEAGTLVAMESRYGVPLRIVGVTLNESTFTEGPPAYCVLDCVNLGTGNAEVIGCGASNVLAGMIKLHQLNAFPIDVVVYESAKRTGNGYNVVLMRKATDDDIRDAQRKAAESL